MSLQQLHNIRGYELEQVLPRIQSGSKVLEIGAGTGWQAKLLGEKGFSVTSIDVPGTPFAQERLWPVLEYDGINLPFRDGCFDVLFSSHVLEHISHVEEFQTDVRRVLKRGGTAIHILPSAIWRLWTTISFPAYLAKILVALVFPNLQSGDLGKQIERVQKRDLRQSFKIKALFPSRHGEIGNVITEIYLFSRFRWFSLFRRTGWTVETYHPSRLFYTGYMILDSKLNLRLRHNAAYILGSSSHIFCLRKADRQP